jgi:hypothetical protein
VRYSSLSEFIAVTHAASACLLLKDAAMQSSPLKFDYTVSVISEGMSMEHWWNDADKGNTNYSEETCLSASLSTSNLTWTVQGSNLGLQGERSATIHLAIAWLIVHRNQLCVIEWETMGGYSHGKGKSDSLSLIWDLLFIILSKRKSLCMP